MVYQQRHEKKVTTSSTRFGTNWIGMIYVSLGFCNNIIMEWSMKKRDESIVWESYLSSNI